MPKQLENAIVKDTQLAAKDHGCMTAWITVGGEGWVQGFGGFALDAPNGKEGKEFRRIGTAWGCEFIKRVVETLGVSCWEKLVGVNVRIERDETGTIIAIAHIIKDRWFNPKRDLAFLLEG